MELSAKEMDSRSQVFVSLKTANMLQAQAVLAKKYAKVEADGEYIRVYDEENVAEIVDCLMQNSHVPTEIKQNKVGLEEYYIQLMSGKEDARND